MRSSPALHVLTLQRSWKTILKKEICLLQYFLNSTLSTFQMHFSHIILRETVIFEIKWGPQWLHMNFCEYWWQISHSLMNTSLLKYRDTFCLSVHKFISPYLFLSFLSLMTELLRSCLSGMIAIQWVWGYFFFFEQQLLTEQCLLRIRLVCLFADLKISSLQINEANLPFLAVQTEEILS